MKQEGAVGSGGLLVTEGWDMPNPPGHTHTHLQEEEGSHSRQEAEKAPQTKGRWGWHSDVPVWRSPPPMDTAYGLVKDSSWESLNQPDKSQECPQKESGQIKWTEGPEGD